MFSLQSPRAPVVNIKSGTIDNTDGYMRKIKNFREGAREQAVREQRENREWANIASYIQTLEGNWWSKDRRSYRSRFADNQLARARKEALALYTDTRPELLASCANQLYSSGAEAVKSVLHYEWVRASLDLRLVECIDHAMLSVGYAKCNGSSGRIAVVPCGMDSVMPINSPADIQGSSAIRYTTWKPTPYFSRFGDKGKRVTGSSGTLNRRGEDTYNLGVGMTEYSWDRLSPALRRQMGNRPQPSQQSSAGDQFPVAALEELWVEDYETNETGRDVIVQDPNVPTSRHNYWYRVRPGERLFPRKRLLIFGGDDLMYDGPSPLWIPSYPFARLALDPTVWGPGGLSKYRTLMPLNRGINEIGAGVFDQIKKAINQTYAVRRGSVSDMDWERFFPDMPGAKLRMNPNSDPSRDLRPIDPPRLPEYVQTFLSQYLLPAFDRHAGTTDFMTLMKKNQVPGGEVFEQIRDSQSAPVRLEGRRVETFIAEIGKICAGLIIQHYNADQRMHLIGPNSVTWQDYDFKAGSIVPAGMAPDKYWESLSIQVSPGSIHGAAKEREQTKKTILFGRGACSLKTLLTTFEFADPEAEIKQIMSERAAGIIPGGQAETGGGREARMTRGQRNGDPT